MKYSKDFTTLAGGSISLAKLRLSESFHQEGFMRRHLLLENTMGMMVVVGLIKDKDIQNVAKILHTEAKELGNITPWDNAGSSNLGFTMAENFVRAALCKLSGQSIISTLEHQEKVEVTLRYTRNFRQNFHAAFFP